MIYERIFPHRHSSYLDHLDFALKQEAFTLKTRTPIVIDSFFVEGASLPLGKDEEGKGC